MINLIAVIVLAGAFTVLVCPGDGTIWKVTTKWKRKYGFRQPEGPDDRLKRLEEERWLR